MSEHQVDSKLIHVSIHSISNETRNKTDFARFVVKPTQRFHWNETYVQIKGPRLCYSIESIVVCLSSRLAQSK